MNYHEEDFVARCARSRAGADVILDNMGAAYLARNIEALAPDGQLVVIGMQGGVTAELNMGAAMAKRASHSVQRLRARPLPARPARPTRRTGHGLGLAHVCRRAGLADHWRAYACRTGRRGTPIDGVGQGAGKILLTVEG